MGQDESCPVVVVSDNAEELQHRNPCHYGWQYYGHHENIFDYGLSPKFITDNGQRGENAYDESKDGSKEGHDDTDIEGMGEFYLVQYVLEPSEGKSLRRETHLVGGTEGNPDDNKKRHKEVGIDDQVADDKKVFTWRVFH